ncbi:alpha/beta fold hydrolase [Halobacillus sp. BBL2006]|uniref:alpha/beta fold hydrolase n=1 Tax=Halobacillus sp. BBL2006 TaxID=1543706 RepID=UPI000541F33F|nr:alpha/beta fold hydrolase [Halobacillus sp. BBL2006]KHE68502.1 carboxymethylenebutenolidase [Halobacillus sp. BBL2006]
MKKFFKYGFISLAVLLVIGCSVFFIWSQQTYHPSKKLNHLVPSIPHEDNWIIFEPKENLAEKSTGIILYPGAKVEPEAYSYIAQRFSDKGYFVGIPQVRLNLSMLDTNKAAEAINQYTSIEKWYVGGHSLGGVSAASFAKNHPNRVNGLIFLASYPSSGNSFADTNLPILSIYAENDGLTTLNKINETKKLLSNESVLYKINGGNHAQFGMYGPQKGDKEATLTAKEQQDIIIDVMSEWLENH